MRKSIVCKAMGILMAVTMMATGCASQSVKKPAETAAPKAEGTQAAGGETTAAAPAAQAEYNLIAAHVSTTEHSFQAGLEAFKREAEEKSGGRISVEIHPNGELGGNEDELVQKMATGTVDVIISAPSFMAQSVKEADILSLPYLFSDTEHWKKCMDGEPGQQISKLVEEKSGIFHVLGYFKDGVRSMYTIKPVEKLEDMKDMKFRIQNSPTQIAFWSALGVQPTFVAFNEIYQALQNGVIDGAENSYSQIAQQKHYEVCKHITETEHDVATRFLLISADKYNSMPEDLRAVIDEAGKVATREQRDFDDQLGEKYKKEMADAGITFHQIDKQQLIDLTETIREEKAKELGLDEMYKTMKELK